MSSGEITVKFRIVGLYFGSVPGPRTNENATGDVEVTVAANPTVKEVVEAVEQKANNNNIDGVEGFRFSTMTGQNSNRDLLDRVEVDYTESPNEDRPYLAGTYIMKQQLDEDPQQVFQYYIFDVEERAGDTPALRLKNTDNSFVPFDQQPDEPIRDGDFITWRLVNIKSQADIPDFPIIDIPDFDIPRLPITQGQFPLARDRVGDDRETTPTEDT